MLLVLPLRLSPRLSGCGSGATPGATFLPTLFPPSLRNRTPYHPAPPPQWHQWLHKAREEPPTDEDIQRGIHQRELYRQRIAEIEREEAQRSFQARSGGGRAAGGFTQQLPGDKE